MPDLQLQRRYKRRLAPDADPMDRLSSTIHTLTQAGGAGDPFFLAQSLELLVTHLDATQAALVMVSGGVMDIRWWYPEGPDEAAPMPVLSYCEWLMEHPERVLVVRDSNLGPQARNLAEQPPRTHKAILGCALRQGESVKALLFAYFDQPRAFTRMDYTLLEAVAGCIGRVLEVEDLKQSLSRLEDALAITQAVMEDSSTRDPETDLPNLRYLEIWEKAMLASDHRPESLVVAECHFGVRNRKDAARVRKAAEGIRAGDLMVLTAPGRFLVIFQHTPRSIAHVLLLRLRAQLGGAPLGATLWLPGAEGSGLDSCRPRLDAALAESRAMPQPGLVWLVPENASEAPPPRKRAVAVRPATPQLWQPPTLRRG